MAPVAPIPPYRIGEAPTDPVALYLLDVMTLPSALAGVPALALPADFVEEDGAKLPVGVQFIGRPLDEATLFRIGRAFEQANEVA